MSKISIPNKLNLAQLPTPIYRLDHLSALASQKRNTEIYVKRDDLTHGPAAGNKIRKLEFHFHEAISRNKKAVVTCGGIQSNHARATALLARQLGLECMLFLRKSDFSTPELNGNYFLDVLAGAKIQFVTDTQYTNIQQSFQKAIAYYRKKNGVDPQIIFEGGSDALGACGYINAFEEMLAQTNRESFDSIVVANGSGGTHAGLLLGAYLNGFEEKTKIISFNVCSTAAEMSERVKRLCISAISARHLPISFMPSDIHVVDGYVGPGYAKADAPLYEFIIDVLREDGIPLDPVYTGKALWGLMQELQKDRSHALFGKKILFIATGGLPSLYAHLEGFSQALKKKEVAWNPLDEEL